MRTLLMMIIFYRPPHRLNADVRNDDDNDDGNTTTRTTTRTTTIELSYRIHIDRHVKVFFNECARAKT